MKLSVIIPTFNAAKTLAKTLHSINNYLPGVEIIISDGGSTDATEFIAKSFGVHVIRNKKGRGTQLNAGASLAKGDILIFLHADTVLPKNAHTCIQKAFIDSDIKIAKFRMNFDYKHYILKLYGGMTRFDSLLTSFGDQCIVVNKTFFKKLNGFPNWPLFEDVNFFQKARRKVKVKVLDSEVITSAEKFRRNGVLRQQWINLRLIISYLLGESPEKLHQKYTH